MIFGLVVMRAPIMSLTGPAVFDVNDILLLVEVGGHRTSSFRLNLKIYSSFYKETTPSIISSDFQGHPFCPSPSVIIL